MAQKPSNTPAADDFTPEIEETFLGETHFQAEHLMLTSTLSQSTKHHHWFHREFTLPTSLTQCSTPKTRQLCGLTHWLITGE